MRRRRRELRSPGLGMEGASESVLGCGSYMALFNSHQSFLSS
jgi:hypothetical protein